MKALTKKKIVTIKDLETKRDDYLKHKFTKYVIDYKVEDDKLKVLSNIGNYRYVRNNASNTRKLNRIIVKNKVEIQHRIDNYAEEFSQRFIVFLINILLICFAGAFNILTFFIGSYPLFLLGLATFQLCILTTLFSGLNYYVSIKEIQNLKRAINYKMKDELEFPKFRNMIKN